MPFDPDVAAILALDGDEARALIKATAARRALPPLVLAGLYLRSGDWNEAHQIAQDIHTPEGSYWHAIVHREEPDDSNAAYWFRQVGRHPIYPALAAAAAQIGIDNSPWDPYAFIEMCAKAREVPDSDLQRQVREVQRAEWQLLFDYCAVESNQ